MKIIIKKQTELSGDEYLNEVEETVNLTVTKDSVLIETEDGEMWVIPLKAFKGLLSD